MKKILLLIISTVIFSTILSGCNTSSGANNSKDKTTLKVASYGPDSTPWHQHALIPWMERAEELSDGELEFDFYPSEQLGKTQDILDLVQDRVADIGAVQVSHFSDEMPLTSSLEQLPYLFEDTETGMKAYYELANSNSDVKEIDYEKNNIKFLMGYTLSPFSIWSKDVEIREPSDLKGAKVRSSGKIETEMFKFAEANPVNISYEEAYEALERGVINTVAYSPNPISSSGVDELIDNYTPTHLQSTFLSLSINEDVWDDLSENAQDAMNQASEEIKDVGEEFDEDDEKNLQEMIDGGTNEIELTEEEEEKWNEFSDDFTKKWLEENETNDFPIEDVIEDFEELVKEQE